MNLLQAMKDKNLFARWFRDPETWAAWTAFIAALFALPMSPEQLAVYRQCTGRSTPPPAPVSETWLICGRRAGKSFVLALVAVYLAAFHNYRSYLPQHFNCPALMRPQLPLHVALPFVGRRGWAGVSWVEFMFPASCPFRA
jgi:hypothetical protein